MRSFCVALVCFSVPAVVACSSSSDEKPVQQAMAPATPAEPTASPSALSAESADDGVNDDGVRDSQPGSSGEVAPVNAPLQTLATDSSRSGAVAAPLAELVAQSAVSDAGTPPASEPEPRLHFDRVLV